MKSSQFYDEYIKVLKNDTKASILAVLILRGALTVTDMVKYIHTSRSNLYHYVKELVDSGFLNKPKSVVVKNYVEKYYTINPEAFSGISSENLYEELEKQQPEDLKDFFFSILRTYSFILKLMGEEARMMGDEDVKRGLEAIKNKNTQVVYSRLSDRTYSKVIGKLGEFVEFLEKTSDEEASVGDSANSIMILAIPK